MHDKTMEEDNVTLSNCCAICNNVSEESTSSSKNRSVYTKTLVELLLKSPLPREDKTVFNYCTGCSKIMDDLLELHNNLVIITNCIEKKLKEIRITMLSCPLSKNPILDKFRGNAFNPQKDDLRTHSTRQRKAIDAIPPRRKSEDAVFDKDETEHSSRKVPKFSHEIIKVESGEDVESFPSPLWTSTEVCVEQQYDGTMIKVEAAADNFGYAEEQPQAFEPWALSETSNSDDTADPLCVVETPTTNNVWPKPKLSLPILIYVAIKNNIYDDKYSTSVQILTYIQEYFPYYKRKTWGGLTSLEDILDEMTCFQPLQISGCKLIKWTVRDTDDKESMKQLITTISKINANSMAFPETLKNIVSKTSVFWNSSANESEIQLEADSMIDKSLVSRPTNFVTLTALQLAILAVANTTNSDGYTSVDEMYNFILCTFPCWGYRGPPRRNSIKTQLFNKPYFKHKYFGSERRSTIVQSGLGDLSTRVVDSLRNNRESLRYPEQIDSFIHNLYTRDSGQPLQQLYVQ